jgi:hypothetical protein
MSDCCCKNDQTVRLIEYTIISTRRCKERILKKGEVLDTSDLRGEDVATWVIAEYLHHSKEPLSDEERRNLRVYHSVLQSWDRHEKDCCGDNNQADVLREINETLKGLATHWRGSREDSEAATA